MDKNHERHDQSAEDRAKELDDFWDIESLLPQKQQRPLSHTQPVQRKQVETVEIDLEPQKSQAPKAETISDVRIKAEKACSHSAASVGPEIISPEFAYSPRHPLVREVRIYRWRSSFRFYERFCTTAKRLFSIKGTPCEAAPFFSYMPQYDQMNNAQRSWYLYWRDNVRAGKYLPTDYSYIFLYLFEVINLPTEIPPHEGQRILCEVWRQYRDTYPLLNRYLADWICDYSLIHQLPPPVDALSDELRLIAESSSFREFYACPTGDDVSHDAKIYLLFCSNYDYRKSKVYIGDKERAEIMDFHIPRAFSAVLRTLEQQNAAFATTKMQKTTLSRDSFIGALCSNKMKRRIEIDYCSFSRSHELRFLITDILKYAENKIRSHFGVKSKLSIYGLPEQLKAIVDSYFAEAIPSKRGATRAEVPRPSYEVLYDIPSTELSAEHATEIEKSSWLITERLVEAFGENTPPQTDEHLTPTSPSETTSSNIDDVPKEQVQQGVLAYRAFLTATLNGDVETQRSIARAGGILLDALVEKINALAADVWGDIVLEESENGGYAVIEDYVENIRSILQN